MSVVTGASRGIGRLLALHLAAMGDEVVAIARPSGDLSSLGQEGGGRVLALPADVTEPAAIADAFGRATAQLGAPTTLITCAGSIDALGPVAVVDPERWWEAVAVDLRGTMLAAQCALRWMLPARQGRIVTVYGNLGDQGAPNLSAFAAAKAAVARFTETLASEVRDAGVTVVGMHPGFVRTPMTEQLAWGDEAKRWVPYFGAHAEKNWGDGSGAIGLVDRLTSGAADGLAGRIVFPGDNLTALAADATSDSDRRRLRIRP